MFSIGSGISFPLSLHTSVYSWLRSFMISCDLFLHPINAGRDDVTWAPETLKKLKKKCLEQGKGLHLTEQFPNVYGACWKRLLMFQEPRYPGNRQRTQAMVLVLPFLTLWKCGQVPQTFCFSFQFLRQGTVRSATSSPSISQGMHQHCNVCGGPLLAKSVFLSQSLHCLISLCFLENYFMAHDKQWRLTFFRVSFGPWSWAMAAVFSRFFSLPQKNSTKGCSADRLPVPDQLQLQVSTHTHPLVNKVLSQEIFSLH